MTRLQTGLLALTFAFSGCSAYGDECGLLAGNPALIVTVTDAGSGERLTTGVTVIAREAEFADTLALVPAELDSDGPYFAGPESRPGSYTVTVARSGYRPASGTGTARELTCEGMAYVTPPVRLAIELKPGTP